MDGKRGLSSVITTLIIILVSLVAIGIIWVVIANVIRSGSEQIQLGQYNNNLEIESVQMQSGNVVVAVQRTPGGGNFVGINFIFSNGTNSEEIRKNVSLSELEQKSFTFALATIDSSTLKGVSVVPIYTTSSGNEALGSVASFKIGNAVNGIFNLDTVCGDGVCNGTETNVTCSADCHILPPLSICGDGVCNATETVGTCPQDCNIPISVTTCQNITSPGNYILQNNLTPAAVAPCMNITNTNNVYFNCQGNSIFINLGDVSQYSTKTAFTINNVSNFSISNCRVQTNLNVNSLAFPFNINNSGYGTISNNVFFSYASVSIYNTSNMQFLYNNFTRSLYQQTYGTGNVIMSNFFNWSDTGLEQANLWLVSTNNTTVFNNTIDGHGTGLYGHINSTGLDDNIALNGETGDNISWNILQNTNDCAIESIYPLSNTTISNNIIRNNGYCGIGGWYYSGWKNNVFSFNTVNNSGPMFMMYRLYPLQPGETNVYFTNNLFVGNALLGLNQYSLYSTYIDMTHETTYDRINHSAFITSNATFINNDFDKNVLGPIINPPSMIIDGGGNKCNPNTLGYLLPNGTVSTSTPLNCS